MFIPLILDEHLLTGTPSLARSSGSARRRSFHIIMHAEPDVKAGQELRAFAYPLLTRGLSSGPSVEKGGE